VLANDDMLQLVKHGVRAGTPVIIAEQLNWISIKATSTHLKATDIVDAGPLWLQPQITQQMPGDWTLLSAFEWTEQQRSVAVLTHELKSAGRPPQRRHSYWVKDQQQWKELAGPL
jgi:hypothetical protein